VFLDFTPFRALIATLLDSRNDEHTFLFPKRYGRYTFWVQDRDFLLSQSIPRQAAIITVFSGIAIHHQTEHHH
jgi:hypothetical protein